MLPPGAQFCAMNDGNTGNRLEQSDFHNRKSGDSAVMKIKPSTGCSQNLITQSMVILSSIYFYNWHIFLTYAKKVYVKDTITGIVGLRSHKIAVA
jgi:hypothetical protein